MASPVPRFKLRSNTGHIPTPGQRQLSDLGICETVPAWPSIRGRHSSSTRATWSGLQLTNDLTVTGGGTVPNVSIVFPGQEVKVLPGNPGVPGVLTNEAVPGGSVTYQFYAVNPGTYTYYSGTDSALQVEMGLMGAIIVRPRRGDNFAYNHQETIFDREYLFLLSEMDPRIHLWVEQLGPEAVSTTIIWPIISRCSGSSTAVPRLTPWLNPACPGCRISPITPCPECTRAKNC